MKLNEAMRGEREEGGEEDIENGRGGKGEEGRRGGGEMERGGGGREEEGGERGEERKILSSCIVPSMHHSLVAPEGCTVRNGVLVRLV